MKRSQKAHLTAFFAFLLPMMGGATAWAQSSDPSTPAGQLEQAQAGSSSEVDEMVANRIDALLTQLAQKTPSSEEDVAEATIAMYDSLQTLGISDSVIDIMEALNTGIPGGSSSKTYADFARMYVEARNRGVPREEVASYIVMLCAFSSC